MTPQKTLFVVPNRQVKIDRFGEVDRQLRLWQPQINPHAAEHEELEAEILSWSAEAAPEKSSVHTGKAYQVEITARGFQRPFSEAANEAAYKLLRKIKGLSMMSFFSVTLAEAKFHLGKDWTKTNVPKRQTGPRSVNVVPIGQAVEIRKAA
jgi:hypothetical protein